MKNLDFIRSLPKKTFLVTGSFWIQIQCKDFFRKPNDIDIVVGSDFEEFIVFRAKQYGGEVKDDWNQYEWFHLAEIKFDDESCIHVISNNPENYKTVEVPYPLNPEIRFVCVTLESILRYKADLLKQYEIGSDKYEKHLKDIGFFIATGKIKI